ncbi:alpha-L-fucosidase [Aestuariibaculum sp. TT11]|uniref:alpha-L-fucosidase n=2 Tax=Aestuariibaculum sediminum TaxID=2770637 RepID=A0A8J6Q3G1_9FLAO|nr:alpha-L-fucosidase [Aestuariibaculum sediminum]
MVISCGLKPLKVNEPKTVTDAVGIEMSSTNDSITLKYGAQYIGKRQDAEMKKFRANRLGQFIHWGLYSIPGGEWNGTTYLGAAEWLANFAKIPNATWDSLQYQFNPNKFNAVQWAKMAKASGFKYVTITTKHHEGFCLWPSEFTEFDIENTPYKKDLLKEFVDAYTEAGIDVYFYYSILDWHHKDWRYDIKNQADSLAFSKYFEFAKNQLLELQQKYPEVKGFWFDGTWDASWKKNGKYSYDIQKALKEVNPNVIVNSRLRADDFGSRHFDSNGNLMGDYQSGYERYLPAKNDTLITKIDWEACMTIPVNQWGYHKDWSLSHVKSANEILELIVKTVSLGGNFLLNYGPKGDGTFRNEELEISNSIGNWMSKYADKVIYYGDYANLKPQDWGYYVKNTNSGKFYGVVFNLPLSKLLKIELPNGKKLKVVNFETEKLEYHHHDKMGYFISLPENTPNEPFIFEILME